MRELAFPNLERGDRGDSLEAQKNPVIRSEALEEPPYPLG